MLNMKIFKFRSSAMARDFNHLEGNYFHSAPGDDGSDDDRIAVQIRSHLHLPDDYSEQAARILASDGPRFGRDERRQPAASSERKDRRFSR
jgi:hypothetical protein